MPVVVKEFPRSAEEIRSLALRLVQHLRRELTDTRGRLEWTTRNLTALHSFPNEGYEVQHFPPPGSSNQKGAFLWDYIAYQQGSGILIAAETEFDSKAHKLKEDFDKLLYVRSPIKLFMFWLSKDEGTFEKVVAELAEYMASCSEYSPGEIFVLYCRTWANADGSTGDFASWLQIAGEPCPRDATPKRFTRVPTTEALSRCI
jgi:hypothetical protein